MDFKARWLVFTSWIALILLGRQVIIMKARIERLEVWCADPRKTYIENK